eukprot:3346562-Amphidinium_carterae.1
MTSSFGAGLLRMTRLVASSDVLASFSDKDDRTMCAVASKDGSAGWPPSVCTLTEGRGTGGGIRRVVSKEASSASAPAKPQVPNMPH